MIFVYSFGFELVLSNRRPLAPSLNGKHEVLWPHAILDA